VLSQALEMAMGLTQAGEAAIWLVDEQTGELFLEAEQGIEDERIRRLRLPVTDTLAGKVIETKEPLRTSREPDSEKVKLKTDYLVEAVVYVPLVLGGIAFGVLAAAHREPGNEFSVRDEKLLSAIADFAAIAIQNSRLYEATDKALASRIEDLAALNHALAHDLRGLMASISGYAELLKMGGNLNERDAGFANNITSTSKRTLRMVDQLLDITFLSEAPQIQRASFDLAEAVATAMADLEGAALVKSMELDFEVKGTPYKIDGDATLLYRSTLNLIDNAVKYSPENTKISVKLTFGEENVTLQVRDEGSGIPEEDLPHLFDKYFRGRKIGSGELGMGLGLHMVHSTVKAHGGEITARNVEGSGAEFTITLPANAHVE
jgi:two-component system sensor histidine kinase KdpD